MIIYLRFYDRLLSAKIDQEFEIYCSYNCQIRKYITSPFLAYQEDGKSSFLHQDLHKYSYYHFDKKLINII